MIVIVVVMLVESNLSLRANCGKWWGWWVSGRPSTRLIRDVYNEWYEWVKRVEATKVLRMGASRFSIWVRFWGEKWPQSWKRVKKGQNPPTNIFGIGPKTPFLAPGCGFEIGNTKALPHDRTSLELIYIPAMTPLPLFLPMFWSLKDEKCNRFLSKFLNVLWYFSFKCRVPWTPPPWNMRTYSIHLNVRYWDLTPPKHFHIGVKVMISTICTPHCFFVEDSCLCSRHPPHMVYCSIKHSIQPCSHQKRSPLATIDNCFGSLVFFSMAIHCDKKLSLWRVTVASLAVHA